VTQQEETSLEELEARQKLIPFVPSATSFRMGWKALQAVRYCNMPASVEYSLPPVSLHRLLLTIRPPKKFSLENIILEVRDNGVGVSADKLAKSEGLGLANTREKAQEIGARFEIRTAVGEGTSITVTVPIS
jgi:two-component sensor histidine kinase